MKRSNHTILALGADIKSRFCLLKNNNLALSKEFGNLAELDNFNKFKRSISKFKLKPDVVAFDSHPGYFSSQLADSFKADKKFSIQHHHAHIASVLSKNNIKRSVIGVVFDGTGYGSDGNIWGGEFMVVNKASFIRAAHLKYLKMPGADLAVKEPWRMAFSITYDCLGDKIFSHDLDFLKVEPRDYYRVLVKMLNQDINSPLTSSAGRLFDAVSSILGVCHRVKYEAEAAIELERLASQSKERGCYEFDIIRKDKVYIIGYVKLIKGILSDIRKGISREDIARKFHESMSNIVVKIVDKISISYNLRDIVLSGGVFQNKILFNSVKQKLAESGYNLVYSKDVSMNDLSICLGQTYIALHS